MVDVATLVSLFGCEHASDLGSAACAFAITKIVG